MNGVNITYFGMPLLHQTNPYFKNYLMFLYNFVNQINSSQILNIVSQI